MPAVPLPASSRDDADPAVLTLLLLLAPPFGNFTWPAQHRAGRVLLAPSTVGSLPGGGGAGCKLDPANRYPRATAVHR